MALFAAAPVALAATHRTRVAIVSAEGVDDRQDVVRDLALEFRAEGFDVRLVGKENEGESLDDWAERARDDGDRALIHVVPGAAGDAAIEVLLVAPERLVLKDTIRRQSTDASDIASVRAVEVTRAALIQVQAALPPAAPRDIVRDDPYAAVAPPRSPFLSASVSPVLTITGQPSLDLLDIGMNLSWLPADYVSLEIQGAIPIGHVSEGAPEGTAYVKATFVDAGASLFLTRADAPFRPYFAVRGGAVVYSMSATPTMGYLALSQTAVSYFSTVCAGASVAVYGVVRLRAEASFGASASSPVLQIGGTEVNNLGMPIALFRIGPELLW
jgi:hypothetical protein